VVDRLAERMGVTEPCRTATELLPGADHGPHRVAGPLARVERDQAYGELICECELVTRGQVREAVNDGLTELEDLRRKVRLGYGPCQAAFCAWRAAGMLAEGNGDGADPVAGLERFLEERWRGQRSTIWGDQARQALLNHAIYRGIFDLRGEGVPDEAAAPTEGSGRRGPGNHEGMPRSDKADLQAGAPVGREAGG
jgi:glycerol-3-phosphate dehydrogenase